MMRRLLPGFTWIFAAALLLAFAACAAPASGPAPAQPGAASTTAQNAAPDDVQPSAPAQSGASDEPGAAPTQAGTDNTPEPTAVQDEAVFQGPLSVRITSPQEDATLQASPVELAGTADPETVISVGEQIVVVDAGGAFRLTLALSEGPNVIEITASDPQGNSGTAYLTVYYEP